MQLVSLRWSTARQPDASACQWLAKAASEPPPALDGLRLRFFRKEDGAIVGRYAYDGGDGPDAARGDPRLDPAAARLTRGLGVPSAGPSADLDEVMFDRPIFILSAPRAGGTLLRELLARSELLCTSRDASGPVIDGIPALHPAARGWTSHRLTDLDCDAERARDVRCAFTAELRDHAGRRLLDVPPEARPSRIRLVERADAATLRVPLLAVAFPDARFVFLHRDARQNVSSMIEAWRAAADGAIPALPGWQRGAWWGPLPDGWRDFDGAELADLVPFQWAAVNQQALDDLELLERDRWIHVDHSELVAAPHAVAARVLALAQLEPDGALLDALDRPRPLGGRAAPSPIKWRANGDFRESGLARYNVLRGHLRELGGTPAAPPPRPAPDPAVRYACFVDRLQPEASVTAEDCIVNPSLRFQWGSTVPLDLIRRTRFRERFVPDVPLAWVEDPATEVLYPYWTPLRMARVVSRLVPGTPPPELSRATAASLVAAGVLVTPEASAVRRRAGDALAEAAGRAFETDRYCVLPSLVAPAHVGALGEYYDALIAGGSWARGDAQVPNRFGWHNESVARYFHHQLARFVGRVAGERVRPSYCYVSAYRGGSVTLKPHVDRKQCVFTVSLWIGERSGSGTGWPLWLHSPAGVVSVTQAAGDGVLLRGCELPHWRDRPPPGGASTALIFHYVPRDFVGVLN